VNSEDQPELESVRQFSRIELPSWLLWSLALLAGVAALPFVINIFYPRCGGSTHLTEATNNLRNLVIFLFAYEDEFGAFPSPENAPKLAEERGIDFGPTTTSNDLLGLLLRGGFTNSEEIFYCRHSRLPNKKPDNVTEPISHILEPGECGFSYVAGLSTTSPGECPILLGPMIPGTTRFDSDVFNGRAVLLRVDQSVKQYELDKEGRIILPNGLDLFDPAQPFWAGQTPDLRHPAR
jgi:hypothetical protein